jgi:hypothetical protein
MCNPTLPDGGACNSLAPSATPVTVQCVSGMLPPSQGGSITNGVYVLAAATYYGASCPSEVERDRWLVCGTNWQTLQDYSTNGGPEMGAADNFNVTQSGTNLQLQGVCGVTESITFGYSATSTTISFYIPTPNTTGEGRVDVYTLQ